LTALGFVYFCSDNSAYDNLGGDKCPKCGSTNVAAFVYGLIEDDPEFWKDVDDGKVIPGGCEIDDKSPKYRCNECDFEWGRIDL
jgi:hypothetical protein